MKSSIKKMSALLTIMAVAIIAFTFTGCNSNDDEPKAISGDEMLKNISMVFAEQADAEKLYQAEEDAPNMILVADSKETAHKLCERFISDLWDGKPRTVKIPDDCGSISLAPAADECVFCTVSFSGLKSCDYPVFTLTIVSEEYLHNENSPIYHEQRKPILWMCNDCGWWTDNALDKKVCKRCGSTNGREPGHR